MFNIAKVKYFSALSIFAFVFQNATVACSDIDGTLSSKVNKEKDFPQKTKNMGTLPAAFGVSFVNALLVSIVKDKFFSTKKQENFYSFQSLNNKSGFNDDHIGSETKNQKSKSKIIETSPDPVVSGSKGLDLGTTMEGNGTNWDKIENNSGKNSTNGEENTKGLELDNARNSISKKVLEDGNVGKSSIDEIKNTGDEKFLPVVNDVKKGENPNINPVDEVPVNNSDLNREEDIGSLPRSSENTTKNEIDLFTKILDRGYFLCLLLTSLLVLPLPIYTVFCYQCISLFWLFGFPLLPLILSLVQFKIHFLPKWLSSIILFALCLIIFCTLCMFVVGINGKGFKGLKSFYKVLVLRVIRKFNMKSYRKVIEQQYGEEYEQLKIEAGSFFKYIQEKFSDT